MKYHRHTSFARTTAAKRSCFCFKFTFHFHSLFSHMPFLNSSNKTEICLSFCTNIFLLCHTAWAGQVSPLAMLALYLNQKKLGQTFLTTFLCLVRKCTKPTWVNGWGFLQPHALTSGMQRRIVANHSIEKPRLHSSLYSSSKVSLSLPSPLPYLSMHAGFCNDQLHIWCLMLIRCAILVPRRNPKYLSRVQIRMLSSVVSDLLTILIPFLGKSSKCKE